MLHIWTQPHTHCAIYYIPDVTTVGSRGLTLPSGCHVARQRASLRPNSNFLGHAIDLSVTKQSVQRIRDEALLLDIIIILYYMYMILV